MDEKRLETLEHDVAMLKELIALMLSNVNQAPRQEAKPAETQQPPAPAKPKSWLGQAAEMITGKQSAPICANHSVAMIWRQTAKGDFWSCNQKDPTTKSGWCNYRPPKA